MALDPKILLSDDQGRLDWPLLRLEIAKVVRPGPWKHHCLGGMCTNCGKSVHWPGFPEGCIPDPVTGPLEVWTGKLMTMVLKDRDATQRLIGKDHDMYPKGLYLFWNLPSRVTPAEGCVCCLNALEKREAQP